MCTRRRYMRKDYMKIKWIEFENLESGLKIERIDFFDDVTLLVGLSGVGKTQILNAISYSLALAVRRRIRLRPYCVKIGIQINENYYEWSYKIKHNDELDILTDDESEYIISDEELKKNNDLVFKRENNSVIFSGYDKIPNPKKDESLLLQYSESDEFSDLIEELKKLYSVEMDLEVRGGIRVDSFNNLKLRAINQIKKLGDSPDVFSKFSHLPVILKIYILKRYFYDSLYVQIFNAIKELFVEIEDVDVEEDEQKEAFFLSMKVYGKTMMQHDISNGMLKTIYYIVELYTMASDSLVLIDEFENGLGVNCIDLLSDLLLTEREDLQFIITSHHPKIINSIGKEKWRIIDRDGSRVVNSDCTKYGIGNSQHDAYYNDRLSSQVQHNQRKKF